MCMSVCLHMRERMRMHSHVYALDRDYVLMLCVFDGCSLGVSGQRALRWDITETVLLRNLVTATFRIDRGASGFPSQNLLV